MTKLRVLMFVCVCALLPATAGADDGGWWEWLQGMSGPKLWGAGTDVHLFCLDKDGHRFRCETLFGLFQQDNRSFDQIRHQMDLRISVYGNHGAPFEDVTAAETPSIHAFKVGGMYYYRPHQQFSVGGGAGYLAFVGGTFPLISRATVTPISFIVSPFTGGGRVGKAFFVRLEESYITKGFTAADFNFNSTYSADSEWNRGFSIGFDFRRR
jgi:hypothetical protein